MAQVYVLKDHRPHDDEVDYYDALPELADTLFLRFVKEDVESMELMTPDTNALRVHLDSLYKQGRSPDLVNRRSQIKHRLKLNLQKQYKHYRKAKVSLNQYKKQNVVYNYAKTDEGNEFCYVTIICTKKKRKLKNLRSM
jgi:hypothetical protein